MDENKLQEIAYKIATCFNEYELSIEDNEPKSDIVIKDSSTLDKQVKNFSQINDDFKKYSYLVGGFAKESIGPVFGTCFFMIYNAKLFLITASHNFSDWDVVNNKPDIQTEDTFFVRCFKEYGAEFEVLKVDTKPIKLSDKFKHPFYKHPDLYAAVIHTPTSVLLNTIDKYTVTNIPTKNPDKIFYWGYPQKVYNDLINNNGRIGNINSVKWTGKINGNINQSFLIRQGHIIDSIDYRAVPDSITDISTNAKGFSGSPVFWSYGDTVIFGGIAIVGGNNAAVIIRPETVYKYLDTFYRIIFNILRWMFSPVKCFFVCNINLFPSWILFKSKYMVLVDE